MKECCKNANYNNLRLCVSHYVYVYDSYMLTQQSENKNNNKYFKVAFVFVILNTNLIRV